MPVDSWLMVMEATEAHGRKIPNKIDLVFLLCYRFLCPTNPFCNKIQGGENSFIFE